MHALLGITKDIDIMDVLRNQNAVTAEEIRDFTTGVTPALSLDPLRLLWDDTYNVWNDQLAHAFTEAFINNNPDVYAERAEEVKAHFYQRIDALRKEITKHLPRTDDESPEEISARVNAEHLQTLQVHRVHERKHTVSQLLALFDSIQFNTF